MSPVRRGAVKFALFLVPALLLGGASLAFGDRAGAALRSLFRKTTYTTTVAGNFYTVPDDTWSRELSDFLGRYVDAAKRHDLSAVRRAQFGFPTSLTKLRVATLTADEFAAFQPPAGSPAKHPEGHFDPSEPVIRLQRPAVPSQSLRPLARELAMAMLHRSSPAADWSPWLLEGAALYHQTDSMQFGGLNLELVNLARQDRAGTVASLLAAESPDLREPAAAARAYSLYHFLRHVAPYDGRLGAWLDEERKPGRPTAEDFARIFGPDAEKQWKEFLSRTP